MGWGGGAGAVCRGGGGGAGGAVSWGRLTGPCPSMSLSASLRMTCLTTLTFREVDHVHGRGVCLQRTPQLPQADVCGGPTECTVYVGPTECTVNARCT